MKRLLFFALLVSLSFAQNWIIDMIHDTVGDIIPILAILSVFIISIIYFVGTMTSKAEWIMLSKDELYHLAFSLLLLASFVGIISFADTLTNAVYDSAKSTLALTDSCASYSGVQRVSTCYMGLMMENAETIIQYNSKKHIDYLLDASQYISYYGFLQGTTFSPYAYKRTWSMTVDNINNLFILPAYMSIMAQYLFVGFFMGDPDGGASSSSIFTLILPAAFVLRFTPFFRDTANLLIAISLGLYTLIPFMIALNGMMYSAVLTDCQAYESIISDAVLGDCSSTGNFFQVASLYPQAFLLPNMIISVFVTYSMAAAKALRMIG